MTSLFHDIIFGPVHSRRLGLSLGVNLLPLSSKLCSFDCIYCECGWNAEHPGGRRFNAREDVRTQLEATLRRMVADGTPPDVITFAGNGEPTMHPEFEAVIGDTIALRDALCPAAKVSVLSNATQIHRDSVRRALLRVDNNILKLDSAFDATVRRMNNPQNASYSVRSIVEAMKRFDGRMILQTMFLRGECGGQPVDNTTEEEVSAWLRLVAEIRPRQVMVYSLDRDTPCPTLEKGHQRGTAGHRRARRDARRPLLRSLTPGRHANTPLLRQDDVGAQFRPDAPHDPARLPQRGRPTGRRTGDAPDRRTGPAPGRQPPYRRRKPSALRPLPR